MKKHIRYIAGALAIAFGVTSCAPFEEDKTDIGQPPAVQHLDFEYKFDAENQNIVYFTNASKVGFKAIWEFGNGKTGEGDQVQNGYPIEGDYTVKMTVFGEGGHNAIEKTVSIEQTNALMLDNPTYNNLTGGAEQLEGKTWVLDKDFPGHLGLGPVTNYELEWWNAPANDKAGLGIYDDKIIFMLDGFGYKYEANGTVFVHKDHVESLGGTFNDEDQTLAYDDPQGVSWSITEDADGIQYITLSDETHIGFYTGASTYEIISLTENELYIRSVDPIDPGRVWYQRLIPEGYEREVPEPEYKIEDMMSDFEGNTTISNWNASQVAEFVPGYDNPATFGLNTSLQVAKYVKGQGEGQAWANLQIQPGYKLDLRERHKFKMKVYLPSYNDYTTDSAFDWWNVHRTLKPMVSVKLQNSDLGGEAHTTQAEDPHTDLPLDQWVELEFDFSEVADREDFDQIVIQIGGEGHFNPGTFFFDDFELLP